MVPFASTSTFCGFYEAREDRVCSSIMLRVTFTTLTHPPRSTKILCAFQKCANTCGRTRVLVDDGATVPRDMFAGAYGLTATRLVEKIGYKSRSETLCADVICPNQTKASSQEGFVSKNSAYLNSSSLCVFKCAPTRRHGAWPKYMYVFS